MIPLPRPDTTPPVTKIYLAMLIIVKHLLDTGNYFVDTFGMEIICETSMRHVHLSQEHLEELFGKGAQLNVVRDLSQPGQYLSDKRVTFVGPKNSIDNVAVLGPTRKVTQVEVSRTDSFMLGLKDVPVRQSGDLDGAPMIELRNKENGNCCNAYTIIAKRHIHLDVPTAQKWNIKDNQIVKIKVEGERGGVLNEAVARVHENFSAAVHIDSDESNALGIPKSVTLLFD